MRHTFLTTIFVWWAWAPRTMHGSNSTQGPLWWIALKLFWDPLALCVWRRPRDNTNTGGHMGLLNKENAPHTVAVWNAPTTTFLVLFLCQNPLDKICKIQNPGSENQNSKSKSKFQNIRNSITQNQKIQNSKIAKSKNPKSKNPKSKIMVCSCACICVFWLHQNYIETTSYKHFCWGGCPYIFLRREMYIWGGGGYLQIMQKCMKRFPSKKSRQGEKCIHRWPPPPPNIHF